MVFFKGFLEDEELFNTYNSFINECKHLEECHIYISRGIQFSTKIHGKDLKEYLSDYSKQPKNSFINYFWINLDKFTQPSFNL
jgi:hypothetical protein